MQPLPTLRLAVLSDLHVGIAKREGWHNWIISPDPEDTLAPTVAALNRNRLDLVIVTGDLTSEGAEEQLALAKHYLERLHCPYLVAKGNHDQRTTEARLTFERVFGERAPVGLVEGPMVGLPAGTALLLLDAWWLGDEGKLQAERPPVVVPPVQMGVPEDQLEEPLRRLQARRPRLLLVCSHFALLSQAAYLAEAEGKDAGHLLNGERALHALVQTAEAVVCLTGHQHFHHILSGDRWVQIATGALAEYPGEYRLVETGPNGLRMRVAGALEPSLVKAALADAAWVVGRPDDRSAVAFSY